MKAAKVPPPALEASVRSQAKSELQPLLADQVAPCPQSHGELEHSPGSALALILLAKPLACRYLGEAWTLLEKLGCNTRSL